MKKLLVGLLCVASSFVNASTITGYWNFDSTLSDQSANGLITAGQNVSLVNGKFARAAYLDGVSSRIRVSDSDTLDFNGGRFSITAWIKPAAADVFSFVVNKRGAGPYGSHTGFLFGVTQNNDGFSLAAVLDDGTGNYFSCEGCGQTYSFDTWYQIGLSYDGVQLKLYVNGVLDSTTTGGTLGSVDNDLPLLIGANTYHSGAEGVASNLYSGIVDEVKIYRGALDDTDFSSLYASDEEAIFDTRFGPISHELSPGVLYQANVVYRAPSDGFVVVYLGLAKCDRNNVLIKIGQTEDNVQEIVGRVGGYTTVTIPVAKNEYWQADHYQRYSSCVAGIQFRPMY